jgi:hypothetical protein
MADVVIRGLEMPKGDLEYVSLWVYGDGRVYASKKAGAASSKRLPDLAVPLPEGHGRLGDLDKLEGNLRMAAAYQTGERRQGMLGCCETIRMAKSIVPAEGGGEDG